MMKIVVLDGYTLNPGDLSWEGIKQFGVLTVHDRTDHRPDIVIKTIGDAEIIFTNKTPLPREVLKKLPRLNTLGYWQQVITLLIQLQQKNLVL